MAFTTCTAVPEVLNRWFWKHIFHQRTINMQSLQVNRTKRDPYRVPDHLSTTDLANLFSMEQIQISSTQIDNICHQSGTPEGP
ncbi:hypothetical protein DCAR_0104574 [Daucus carota subsp. sativus]|uniref:Uncharacterized protein n=1 Tax=Daucus carota subsp. sativus TaxID=79200 RepID=A0A166IXR7_DAUCS|nr:hypothetical protein DCAR_0104574 [Daucus carota subsp. sativus]